MKTAVSSQILPHLFEHMVVDVVLVNETRVPEIVCSGTLIFYAPPQTINNGKKIIGKPFLLLKYAEPIIVLAQRISNKIDANCTRQILDYPVRI